MKSLWLAACAFMSVTLAGETRFEMAEGFKIARACEAGAVEFPMFGALAEDGRLFVTESSGGDLYDELQKQTRRCRVRVLKDADGDGKFEKSSVFAEGLVFPMGVAWRGGKLFVADPPELVTLEDTDGDGRADKRTVILSGFGHLDNGSLHGLTFGPDGWLFMTTGQPDGFRLQRADGTVVEGKSGALLRCKADGSDVEVLCRGFENLVEVVFMPGGEMVGTVNWFSLPQEGVRDALALLVPGGVYPLNAHAKVEAGNFFSGELLPAIQLYPAVAFSGLMRHSGKSFPEPMRDSLFSAQFNTRKVGLHRLVRSGSTFRSEDEDFVSTDDPDFHPSDVLEAADGSILVLDTGSWYVHHCPTGRIRKTSAPGGIYRISYSGPKITTPAPDAQKTVSTDDPFERHRFIYDLHRTADKAALLKMLEHPEPSRRRAALIVLDQAPHHALTLEAALNALRDRDEGVRRAAVNCFRKHRDWMPHAVRHAKELLLKDPIADEAIDLASVLSSDEEIGRVIAEGMANSNRPAAARVALIEIAAKSQAVAGSWNKALRSVLQSKNASLIAAGLRCAAALHVDGMDDVLSALVTDSSLSDALRLEALRQISAPLRFSNARHFEYFIGRLAATNSATIRLSAAESANARLSAAQVAKVAFTVEKDSLIGPSVVSSFGSRKDLDDVTRRAIEGIQEHLKTSGADQRKIVEQFESLLDGGDENRGQQVFLGKGACAGCHRVGKHGGLVGPDLTRIGAIRAGRDLVEALALPSASFAQGYEPYRVELVSSDILSGVRVRQADDAFVLREAGGAETRLRPEAIKRAERSSVSIMPEGLLNALTQDEIRDLLAYLQKLK